ncbi:MAG: DsbA family protein [Candidatus Moranbacteria bacterium]|nr:DsbA family protein [Candidatus Moranbacteria bacterium]
MAKDKKREESLGEEIIEEALEDKAALSSQDKTKQNYLSIIILLLGLLAGSIFVDVADLVRGEGVSQKRLSDKDIFEYAGKTWVAYPDPVIDVTVVNDENCKECEAESAILALKSAIPTIVPKQIGVNSEEGEKLLKKTGSKAIPVFVFTKTIEKSEVFPKIQNVLSEKDGLYVLDTSVLGVAGKYTELPPFESKNQEVLGNPEAKISIIEFSDFQCPYCKVFYESLDKLLKEGDYKNKVKVSFKHLPLSFHAQSNNAAMAAECAGEQNRFWDMYNLLYSKQNDWQGSEGTAKFKTYAVSLKLDTAKFNQCMDTNKLQGDIDTDKELAKEYNISGTPAIFVGDEFISGAIQYEELKSKVDALLAK